MRLTDVSARAAYRSSRGVLDSRSLVAQLHTLHEYPAVLQYPQTLTQPKRT